MISVPIYLVIARNVLGNPKLGCRPIVRRAGANHLVGADSRRYRLLLFAGVSTI